MARINGSPLRVDAESLLPSQCDLIEFPLGRTRFRRQRAAPLKLAAAEWFAILYWT
jgi:hypothetical protein